MLTQIFGGTVYMAAGRQSVNVQNIGVGNWEDLKKVLNESGIGEKDHSGTFSGSPARQQ